MKKALFVGDLSCPYGSVTKITLSEELRSMDRIEIEYGYEIAGFRPVRAIMEIPKNKSIYLSSPVYSGPGGLSILELQLLDFKTLACSGIVRCDSDSPSGWTARVFAIYKVYYKSRYVIQ